MDALFTIQTRRNSKCTFVNTLAWKQRGFSKLTITVLPQCNNHPDAVVLGTVDALLDI